MISTSTSTQKTNYTMIKVPAWWATADTKDIERELVGLINEAEGRHYSELAFVTGVKYPHVYGAKWTTVARSRFLRKPSRTMQIRWTAEQ